MVWELIIVSIQVAQRAKSIFSVVWFNGDNLLLRKGWEEFQEDFSQKHHKFLQTLCGLLTNTKGTLYELLEYVHQHQTLADAFSNMSVCVEPARVGEQLEGVVRW